MSNASHPRAIIIGASLSGLFAAVALRAAGWKVDVFERSPHCFNSGGGLVLQADVFALLRFAGIHQRELLESRSGERIYFDQDDRVVYRSSMSQAQTSWRSLHACLVSALPGEQVHYGERLVSFRQTDQQATALFASDRIETADLLVAADGPNSTVRAHLLPGISPTYAGYVAWRGIVPEAEMRLEIASKLGSAVVVQQGQDHQMVEFRVARQEGPAAEPEQAWSWVWYRKMAAVGLMLQELAEKHGPVWSFDRPPSTFLDASVASMRRQALEHLAPSLSELVLKTKRPLLQAVTDLVVPRMVFGRTVLIGDAAFVVRPHTERGAAKAAANALALARALQIGKSEFDVGSRLAAWEIAQTASGTSICAWGISIGDRIMNIK